MNIFRLAADLMHLASIFILLIKIYKTKSASGISYKTQVLYVIVFCTRYLDLFTNFVSIYNTVMKVFFISSSIFIVYLMRYKLQATWQPSLDTFKVEYLLAPSAALALMINHKFTTLEILWTFSIYLESVAILPQLFQLQRTGEAESITSHYLFALGGYRALYIFNWIYRYFAEGICDWIVICAGIVQTLLYSDFLYLYITKVIKGYQKLPI